MEIKVPAFSESVHEGTLLEWHKQPGETVKRGDLLTQIETDKIVLDITALADGAMGETLKQEGETVLSEEVIGHLNEGQVGSASSDAETATKTSDNQSTGEAQNTQEATATASDKRREELSPAVRKVVVENNLHPQQIAATGPKGNITKADALNAASASHTNTATASATPAVVSVPAGVRPQQRVPMTRIRARIAERLKEVQNTAALLTTFNEVNMQPVMSLRKKYQDKFVAKHGVKLGFMSLFVRAATEALKAFPVINASIDGKDIIYHGFYDVGIAVASERGLVVPILRDTDQLTLADIEKEIAELAQKAKTSKLTMNDMEGGTFSITNGGTFGSMMSTPIINAPQSAILGMHNIIERPIAQNGQVVIAPMMYLALSYDHRIIDGKEAVQFLVMIKDLLEDPARLLLDL